MSEQYPPQQPDFQPGLSGSGSPNPYEQPAQQPYGQQSPQSHGELQPHGQESPQPQPYAQQAPQAQPYSQQPYGQQPYGQQPQPYGAPQPYGQQPYGAQPYGAMRPQRPGAATGASVLGIVSGGLGIILGVILIIAISTVQAVADALGSNAGLLVFLTYLQAFGTFGAAVALLVGGIMFLKGKGYSVLLIAAFVQAALVLISLIATAMTPGATGFNYLGSIIGAGLAGFTIYELFTPAAKQWKQ